MSRMFSELIGRSRRIDRDTFARDFGGVADDVVAMLESDGARQLIIEAREVMETSAPLPNGQPRLQTLKFGLFSEAPELERGEVAAVDGTTPLPIQMYSAGQALCVGVGSLSHRRPLQDSLHYWSSKVYLAEAADPDDMLKREEEGIFGISQTAYLRYFEILHGLQIDEPYILFDGPLVEEWLLATNEGLDLYEELFASGKGALGVIKQIKANAVFATFARALQAGECYVIGTLADYLALGAVAQSRRGVTDRRYARPAFARDVAPKILRGIFKPRKKAFGFEVHEDQMETMIRILAADCQLNYPGHEIPYLLNRVDEEVGKTFGGRMLQDRIALRLASENEELFFEEGHERRFR